jgi:Replication-relaxation
VESILLSLKRFDYLTRPQLQTIHKLKGDRNANRFLNSMSQYLGSFRHGLENVYYLNKAGREHIGCDVIRKKTPNIQHFLMRNQLWIAMGMPHAWENELKVIVKDISIVCDARFLLNKVDMLVEIDVTQSMAKNRLKIEKYKRIKELTGNDFHLIWVTETPSRKAALKKLMEAAKIPGRVYTFTDIQ